MKTLRLDDFVIALVLGLSVALWTQVSDLKSPFDTYPKIVIGLMGVFAVFCLLQNRIHFVNQSSDGLFKSLGAILGTVVAIFVYIFAIGTIGYFVSTFVYLAVFFLLNSKEVTGWKGFSFQMALIDISVAAMVIAVIALVFRIALKLVFPEALLF